MIVMAGSTIQPVSRSSTTEAAEASVLPVYFDRRAMRSTSPPMVVGRALETNWPAK